MKNSKRCRYLILGETSAGLPTDEERKLFPPDMSKHNGGTETLIGNNSGAVRVSNVYANPIASVRSRASVHEDAAETY